MRVIFAGSPEPAVPVLRALADSPHEVAIVVSQPDRRRGRGGRTTPTPVAAAATDLGIPVIRPESINAPDALAELRAAEAGALCVAAFGQILRADVLSGWPCINVHYSRLPAYRGAAPVERAIMDGQTASGVTIMQMDAGLDTGPIIAIENVPIGPADDAGTVFGAMAAAGGRLLVAVLDDLAAGRLAATAQPEAGVSPAPRITDVDRPLDPRRTARELADRTRALSPHIGATLATSAGILKVWRAAARAEQVDGLVVADGRFMLGCADGALELLEIQPPSRARMAAGDFLRGQRGALELIPG